MDNKEYVMEKLAFNYAGTLGRILARLGNKKAQTVIGEFKRLHSKALNKFQWNAVPYVDNFKSPNFNFK